MKLPSTQGGLAATAKRGSRYSLVSSVAVGCLQVLQLAILARILTPSDFAVAALATIAVGLMANFSDFGLSSAIVHFQHISDDELSTLYLSNLAIGFILMLLVIAVAPTAASYYGSSELAPVLRVLGPSIFLSALGGQFRALHQKALDFRVLAIVNICGNAAFFLVAVLCAAAGLGVVSIAWGALAGSAVGTAIVIFTGVSLHRPKPVFRWRAASKFLRFGSYQAIEDVLDFLNMQMDSLVLGKLSGIANLGYYAPIKSMCQKPITMINPILTRVSFPVMSIVQGDLPRVRNIYLFQVHAIASVMFPLYAFAFAFAQPLVILVFGEQWLPAVPVMRAIAVWAALISIGNPVGSLLFATGHVRRSLGWNIFAAIITPVAVVLVASLGATAVAVTMVGVQLALLIPSWYYLVRHCCGARLGEYLAQFRAPLVCALAASVAAWLAAHNLPHGTLRLAVGCVVGGIIYLGLSWMLNRRWFDTMREVFVPRRKQSSR